MSLLPAGSLQDAPAASDTDPQWAAAARQAMQQTDAKLHRRFDQDDDIERLIALRARAADHLIRLAGEAEEGSLTFANFVEFDSLYGHRRDVSGYARALEGFDARVGAFLDLLRPGDLAVFTADHGNDPTFRGSDHTRERVPVLAAGHGAGGIGLRGYVDVGASVAAHLGLPRRGPGESFL